MSEEMSEVARVVEQATRKASELTAQTVPVGGMVGLNEMGAVLAGNEAFVIASDMSGSAGGGSGANGETLRQGELSSWKVYWDQNNKAYSFYDPVAILPDGSTLAVTPSVSIESNKTYYAHIWKKDGLWGYAVKTDDKKDKGGAPEIIVKIAEVGDLDKPGTVRQCQVGAINVTGDSGASGRPKPFDLSIEEEEVEIGEEKGHVSVPKFTNTVFFFDGEEWELDKNNVGALSGGETIYLQMKRKVNVDEETGAKTYEAWEASLETSLEQETEKLEVIGIVLYEIGTGEGGKAIVKLDKRDASIDLGRVIQTDGGSIDENTDGSLALAGFGDANRDVSDKLADALGRGEEQEEYDAQILIRKKGMLKYMPIGKGLGGGAAKVDNVSIGRKSDGALEIKDFSKGTAEDYTLAEKLSADEPSGEEEGYGGQVLVRLGGKLVYVPVGCGLGKGGGGEITIQGTDGSVGTGSTIVFEAEDNTNITFKASADNNGTVTVKVGVYYRS